MGKVIKARICIGQRSTFKFSSQMTWRRWLKCLQ